MKVIRRAIVVGAAVCTVISVMTLISCSSTGKDGAAQPQADSGQWVDPANPSDQLVTGPYRVDPNWPKPLAELFPEEKGWTWGAVQGVFVQNPDRIFVTMRGELPDLTNAKKKVVEIETSHGTTARGDSTSGTPGSGLSCFSVMSYPEGLGSLIEYQRHANAVRSTLEWAVLPER